MELFSQPFLYPSPARFQQAKMLSKKSQKRVGGFIPFTGKFVFETVICSSLIIERATSQTTGQRSQALKENHSKKKLEFQWLNIIITIFKI